jgi:triacylglycerol lipase
MHSIFLIFKKRSVIMKKEGGRDMATKYPILLLHGVVLKDVLLFGRIPLFKAFGKIEDVLRAQGYDVFYSDHDGLGSIENNAVQIKESVEKTLAETGAEKVNLIVHSKGGLDSLYMIDRFGMRDQIASLTFVSTPHRGSPVANFLYGLPKFIFCPVSFLFNLTYRLLGDEHPDAKTACRQLCAVKEDIVTPVNPSSYDGIYMQSYSATMKRSRDDLVMGIPLLISKHYGNVPGDGMVSVASCKYALYRGDCTEFSASHSEIVDLLVVGEKRKSIHRFYLTVAKELAQMGF